MEHWFVYYRLPESARTETIERVRQMQGTLAAEVGDARLVERADGAGTLTFMEIYESVEVPARFSAMLEDAVLSSGLAGDICSARRTERFKDV